MKTISDKTVLLIGGFLDNITISLLSVIQIYYLCQLNIEMFLLATCANGIWCISSSIGEFLLKQKIKQKGLNNE